MRVWGGGGGGGVYHDYLSSIGKGGSGPPCMKNIPHLHAELHQFCMYGKHTTSTRRIGAILRVRRSLFSYTRQFCMCKNHARPTEKITPILHVRKTRLAYGFGFDCTQNTRKNQRLV